MNRNLLVPLFQPVVDLPSSKVKYYECLGRVRYGTADSHLGLFEYDSSNLVKADLLMLMHAVNAINYMGCNVGVNLAQKTILEHFNLFEKLDMLDSDIRRNLVIEVTEHIPTIDSIPTIINFVKTVRNMGFKVAIDDIGTGSFSDIDNTFEIYDADYFKLSANIVNILVNKGDNFESIASSLANAKDSGALLIAENIETHQMLSEIKPYVHMAQGYLYSKPGRFRINGTMSDSGFTIATELHGLC